MGVVARFTWGAGRSAVRLCLSVLAGQSLSTCLGAVGHGGAFVTSPHRLKSLQLSQHISFSETWDLQKLCDVSQTQLTRTRLFAG